MNVHGTVYVSRGRGKGGGRVIHTSPSCHYITAIADDYREVSRDAYPNAEICARCIGRHSNGWGNKFGTPNGLCPHCHGVLDSKAVCDFCERYAEVFGET